MTRPPTKNELRLLELKKKELLARQERYRDGLPFLYGHKWYDWQRQFYNSLVAMRLMSCANQVGKALPDETPIPTPDGFRPIGELKVGDVVFGRDGKPTTIVAVPFKDNCDSFKITFRDGASVEASAEHVWICKTSEERFRRRHREKENPTFDKWVTKTTVEMVAAGSYSPEAPRPYSRVSIPFCEPVEYGGGELFDPYLIGLLIGDGGLRGAVVLTTGDEEIAAYVESRYQAKRNGHCGYRLNGLQPVMRNLGLYNLLSVDKHIPAPYLEGSVSERVDLLRGLMDTDGTIYGKGNVSFCTISPRLRDDFRLLVASLGGKTTFRVRKTGYRTADGAFIPCQDAYEIKVNIDLCPFRLKRKADKYYKISRRHERIIEKIEPTGVKRSTCITVDNADGSFLCTRDYIVTHNSSVHQWDKINRATNFALWEKLWPGRKPDLFWFWMTDEETIDREVRLKWLRWLPQGDFKDSTQYGWKLDANKKGEEVKGIAFNSGVYLQFLAYSKSTVNVQSATVWDMGLDEEMPVKFWDEAYQRISSTGEYLSAAFTATINQLMWWRAMEGKGQSEMFPDAFKLQVSKYDCLYFDDGSSGLYTKEQVDRQSAACSSESQRRRRIFGGFAPEAGLKYHTFDPTRHYIEPVPIPKNWLLYSGVDIGSGDDSAAAKKKKNHPAAFYFVAVRPDYLLGYVFKGRRIDDEQTTSGDVYNAYVIERADDQVIEEKYDYHAKDFGIIAERNGESFLMADKSHSRGEEVINTLFANDMLFLFDTPEVRKIGEEILTLMKNTDKRAAVDDGCDAMRYAVVDIPWDFSKIKGPQPERKDKPRPETREEVHADEFGRGSLSDEPENQEGWGLEEEIDEWNDLIGS